jgi:3-carboxy-cis,cis-muconate cycloisomerase
VYAHTHKIPYPPTYFSKALMFWQSLLTSQFHDEAIAHIFSETQFVNYLLRAEVALAQSEAKLGVIPPEAAQAIAAAADTLHIDTARLSIETERDGVPITELVKQLRAHVGGDAAHFVHWGATTQDILDTALILQIRDALDQLIAHHSSLITRLATLANTHRHTIMAGRTHSQQALPITFGFKVACWLAPLLRHRERLTQLLPRVLVAQFGGAVGTLAALGEMGYGAQKIFAEELKLNPPTLPWHTQRDGLVEVANWLSLITGSLAKMAQDIILMAQSEVGELSESGDATRGGSSTMPQKSNPIVSERIVAAARTNATLLANMHHALIHEHERSTHGWQMEWLTLPQMFALTAGALKSANFLASNLVVNVDRMTQNVRDSNGLMLAERLSLALTPALGRENAKHVLREACEVAIRENRHVVDVLQILTDAKLDWKNLRDEHNYLGATQQFINRVMSDE